MRLSPVSATVATRDALLLELPPAHGSEGLANGVEKRFLQLVLCLPELVRIPEVCQIALRFLDSDVRDILRQLHTYLTRKVYGFSRKISMAEANNDENKSRTVCSAGQNIEYCHNFGELRLA